MQLNFKTLKKTYLGTITDFVNIQLQVLAIGCIGIKINYFSIIFLYGLCHYINLNGEVTMWKSPKIREVAVGLEINCYACAELQFFYKN